MFRRFLFSIFFLTSCHKVFDGNRIDSNLIKENLFVNSSRKAYVLSVFGNPNFRIKEKDFDCFYYVSSISNVIFSIKTTSNYSYLRVCFDDRDILREFDYKIKDLK